MQKNILNKRYKVTEYIFDNLNRVVVNMNNFALDRMSNTQYKQLNDAVKVSAFCSNVDGRGYEYKSMCGTFKQTTL